MSNLVPENEIEDIVGIERHEVRHYVHVKSKEEMVYILHSQQCRDFLPSLLDCSFSKTLAERGIDLEIWKPFTDRPVWVIIDSSGVLLPVVEFQHRNEEKRETNDETDQSDSDGPGER